jgi:hypothetical protein
VLLAAGDTIAGDMAAGDMAADDLVVDDLVAGDMVADDLVAGDMVAGDMVAGDMVVGDVLAREGEETTQSRVAADLQDLDGEADKITNQIKALWEAVRMGKIELDLYRDMFRDMPHPSEARKCNECKVDMAAGPASVFNKCGAVRQHHCTLSAGY